MNTSLPRLPVSSANESVHLRVVGARSRNKTNQSIHGGDALCAGRGFRATIKSVQGQPALVVNGEPRFLHVPFLYKAPYESFAAAQAGIYMISDAPIPIRPDGSADTAAIEREADALLAREQDALLVLRTCLGAPDWWMD